MQIGLQTAAYISASILFILSLGGLAKQETAKRGNYYGMIGMAIAVVATAFDPNITGGLYLSVAIGFAAIIGVLIARKVEMTDMPQLVAILHSFVGAAAVLVGFGSYLAPSSLHGTEHTIHLVEIFIGIFIGSLTFSGSVVAYLKLTGKINTNALWYPGKHTINILIVLSSCYLGYLFVGASGTLGLNPLLIMTLLSAILGVILVMAIGGADMPVVVSMLNSYSGWAAAAAGFMLSNDLLIVVGALVGSSGAILSYIMCEAMNRSFFSVIFGGIGKPPAPAAKSDEEPEGEVCPCNTDEVVTQLKAAKNIVIVPGYGMAVAKAQYPIHELTKKLISKGCNVRFAIHPVAGRLPGHMNVLLAEANVPYDIVVEMDEINGELPEVDVLMVVGANDIVNPAALEDPSSSIYGMPVIEAWNAKKVIVLKRGMSAGYAGIINPLFYKENTTMLFGDAKSSIDCLISAF